MRPTTALLLLTWLVFSGCGGTLSLGEPCVVDRGAYCKAGLVCTSPACDRTDPCVGVCRLPCASATACPAGCACQGLTGSGAGVGYPACFPLPDAGAPGC